MIIIFDMDDTLYDESKYVMSSMDAVAKYLSEKYLFNKEIVFKNSILELETNGRGKVFDAVLKKYGIYSKKEVLKCIGVYRRNIPQIKLFDEASMVLRQLSDLPKYVVSDGNKLVQSMKADALGLDKYFKKIVLTHRYGVKHAKPSSYCFSIIKDIENCEWSDLVYIGDDPNKDFVQLNSLGVRTIRVHTGRFIKQKAKEGFDANYHINDLSELNLVLGISYT